MNENQFSNQMTYSATVAILARLRAIGIITDEEYREAELSARRRISPVIPIISPCNVLN